MKNNKIISLFLSGILVLVFIIVPSVLSHPSLSSNEFCESCHEMTKPVVEYKKSMHYLDPSGVKAGCSDCHIPDNIALKLATKIGSLREVYGHLTGVIDTAAKFEDHRATMADNVWKKMEANDSRECRTCHDQSAFRFETFKDPEEGFRMKKALHQGHTCIDCHKGIAHEKPDLNGDYQKLFTKLSQDSEKAEIEGDTVYPLMTVVNYDGQAGKKEGRIVAATKLTILEKSDQWLKVRIDGWQKKGVDSLIYELQGKLIYSAALSKAARLKTVIHETIIDPDTNQPWNKVSFETWVESSYMVENLESLWELGEKMHRATCGACHKATPSSHFLANQWMGTMRSMKSFINHLNKEEHRFLQKYLQLHARDVMGDHLKRTVPIQLNWLKTFRLKITKVYGSG